MRGVACIGRSAEETLLLPLLIGRIPDELGLPAGTLDACSPDGYPGLLYAGAEATLPVILKELVDFLESRGVISCFLRSHPVLGGSVKAFGSTATVVEHAPTVCIPLEGTLDDIRRRMRQGHRYEILKGLEAGYDVRFDDWNLLPVFRAQYNVLMDRVDATDTYRFSDRYFEQFAARVDGSAHLATVLSPEGEPAAGSIFTSCGGILQYHLAASDPRFGKDAVQKLVVDSLVGWGLERGADVLHLGGGVGARDDSLLQFKSGFGGKLTPYRTFHWVCNRELVDKADEAWRGLAGQPASMPTFFPLYRAPLPTSE